ncbi:MAG: B3/B4 domain-containing protein [Dongiaceae bacterium]
MTIPVAIDISEVVTRFPAFRVALVVVRGLRLPEVATTAVDDIVARCQAEASESIAGQELANLPELAVWREAYKGFGVKKTSYRSSVERLLKSVQRGDGLPRINPLVDIYNAVSAQYRLPIGADDLNLVALPLAFRYARPTDTFIALGDASATPDPPKAGEVVYADAEKCLCRRWNWYQDARSACSHSTSDAVLTVQSLGSVHGGSLEDATRELCERISLVCAGTADFGVVDHLKPNTVVG